MAILSLLAAPVLAQDSPSVFIDRVDVNIVNVEVFVTDRSGKHVEGLTVDDFEIYEDGERVEITNFFAVARPPAARQASESQDPAPSTAQTAPPPAAAPKVDIPPEQRLHLLVYIDNFNIRPGNRRRVLASLDGFLEGRTDVGDRIMLVAYDRGLETIQTFTDNPEQITTALAHIRDKTRANGLNEDMRRRSTAQAISAALQDPLTAGSAQSYLSQYIQETRANLQHSTQAIGSVLQAMAGLPGRKAMLYVSDGLPQRPGEQLQDQFFGADSISIRSNDTSYFQGVVRQANAQQVTLYTLDARGSVGTFTTAEYADNTAGGVNRVRLDAERTMNYQGALIDMSEPTGGTAFINSYNFGTVMDNMAKDFDNFYSLGYTSPNAGDGKYHAIDVRVKGSGLSARHRSGFNDKSEIERVQDQTMASLIAGLDKNPLGVRLEFEQAKKKGKRYLLPTLIRIPLRDLTLLPNGDVQEGKLRIFLVVQDEDGSVSPMQDLPYPLSIPSAKIAAARQSAIGSLHHLEIRPGRQKIAVGVWDELSGTESFTQQVIDVGAQSSSKKSKRTGR
ncbi:MAG: VWA domain-containing protein [Acidobacteriota bacterium]